MPSIPIEEARLLVENLRNASKESTRFQAILEITDALTVDEGVNTELLAAVGACQVILAALRTSPNHEAIQVRSYHWSGRESSESAFH